MRTNMFPAVLFHGTKSDLEIGDVITPQGIRTAYASESIDTARVFATKIGRVFEVEPVNKNSCTTRQMRHTGSEVHYETVSDDGFRVVARLPKGKSRDAHYWQIHLDALAKWVKDNFASYCSVHRTWHVPDEIVSGCRVRIGNFDNANAPWSVVA